MGETTLGPYRLLSELGAGGFGRVYLALDPEGRTVAVKVLHPQVAADAAALARLAREVETMRRVRGPHVAEVLDVSLDGARPYLVTRYIQGKPLSALPLPVADLPRLARGLAAALAAMHDAGVVHRDLKPANVIMSEGEPVVIDFGIARAFDSLAATAPGAVIGTPGYLAPEVIEGRPAGPSADVFSFGATLAFAATGRHPFGEGPLPAVAYRVVHHEPDLEGVPGWLAPLLADCLRREPAERPTAALIRERLGVLAGTAAPYRDVVEAVPAGASSPVVGTSPGVSSWDARSRDRGASGGPGVHDLPTRQWGAARRRGSSVEEALARQREKVRRRWVIGSGLFVSLLAAAARTPLPEVSLFLIAAYALAVVADAGVGLVSRSPFKRARLVVDFAGIAGTAVLWLVLSSVFSPFTLALFAVTVLVAGVIFLFTA
ncbi:serine/threonine-protein kinase [Thermoactinospora rubra]|uniref:serine/threonine-protein kinase n=1 Tax=Thermoactinospora rubra TaxID=1088767 RepID=UPI000A115CEF|nr:serine/threonine-protein kinase [Thermoactinospora rubra]